MSFLYDDAGLRTQKVVDGTTVTYTWSGTTLLSEATDTYILIYLYDESASPIGFQYKTEATTETYFYEKNIQGDIVAVYSEAGAKLISYAYDAWGNANISFHNDSETTNAIRNPFTYEVVLGRSGSYEVVAESRGSTYFHTTDARWTEVHDMFGVRDKGMWKINKAFLNQQISAGSTFALANNPATSGGYFF